MGAFPEKPTPKTKERLKKLEAIMKSKRKKPVYFCGEHFWKWNDRTDKWEIVTE